MSEFGGAWSKKKVDCVSAYLTAYQTALKRRNFRLVYIDAFCGDGSQKLKGGTEATLLGEGREFMRGSAQRAIELESPFHAYHFIDKSKKSLGQLKTRLVELKPELTDRMHWHQGDVNVELPKIVRSLDQRSERAVVFADPYGMQLDFETVETVGRCPIIDFWYLVPTGLAINRLATKDGKVPAAWADRLDRFLGEKEWRSRWYRRTESADLFGPTETIAKIANLEQIEADFQARLGKAFALCAKNKMRLEHQGRVLFTLMFACSNPSPKAHALAIKIANHLLKG
jgi:three-Cys-motif partner protein